MRTAGCIAAVAVLVLAGALAGCRGSDTGGGGGGAIKTDVGVTTEPCPQAIDKTKGCIYLGTISDLTVGPFAPLAVPITNAQKAFWKRVNKAGGIGGYEIDVTTYVRDNKYNPQTHNEVYQEIKGKVLGSGPDPRLADDGRDHRRPQGEQHRRRAGVVDVGLGLRGRHPRVRRELLHRVDERRRLRQGASSRPRASWRCTTPATTATTPRPAPSTPPRSSA